MKNRTILSPPLTVLVLLSIISAQALGAWYWPPSGVQIDPQNATSADVVVITLSGDWPDTGVPDSSAISVSDNNIYFDVIDQSSWGFAVITPWERRRSVGPLAAGTYTVYTKLLGDFFVPETYTQAAEFTITETNTYVFDPNQSIVVEDGGFGGWHNTYFIEGQFILTINWDTNSASFDQVDAVLNDNVLGGYGQNLNNLFDMTELVGTVINDTEIVFDTNDPMPGGKVVHLDMTLADDSAYLTGGFCEPWADGFCYDMNSVASMGKHVYYVDAVDGNDSNNGLSPERAFATIQKAVDTAKTGDSIILAQGVYNGQGNRDIDFSAKALTVRSTDPDDPGVVEATIIDCQNNGSGFRFRSNEPSGASISGLTIINASTSAIYCHDYSSPTINNCVLMNNDGFYGGAISCISHSSPAILNCTILDNTAHDGGGICCLKSSDPTITNCVVSGNSAGDYGGGIYIGQNSNATILNCTITGNSAVQRGGGVNASHTGNADIINSIIWNNVASNGSQIAALDSACSVSYSNVQYGQGSVYFNNRPGYGCDGCTLDWGLGNIDTDPCFVDPANGNYQLKSEGWRWDSVRNRWDYDGVTSRCIDAGNPGCSLGDELMTVPPDPSNEYGVNIRVNMGACGGRSQASMPPHGWTLLADLTNDGIVNSEDFANQAMDWLESYSKQFGDLNRDGTVSLSDVLLTSEDWLKTTIWH